MLPIIGFSSLGCPDATLEQALDLAEKFGLATIELRALGGSLDLPAYLQTTYGTPQLLADRLRGCSVHIVALDTSLRIIGGAKNARDECLRLVPWAEALGVQRLRVFDGGKSLDRSELTEAKATLAWWQQLRRDRGWRVDLMVETHDSLLTAAAVQRLLEEAPGTDILWDTHHTWKRGKEDPVVTWGAIAPHVCHIHVKDSVSRPSANGSFTYVLPGEGEFPMASLMIALREGEFAGPVCLEWKKLWHPYLGELEQALAAANERAWWNPLAPA